jgi:hypothetical protein
MFALMSLWFVVPNNCQPNNQERERVMTRINLGERNDLALCVQSMRYKEDVAEEIQRMKVEKVAVDSNETAKREIATELMNQGLSEVAICRILNITEDQLPKPMPPF